MDTIIFITGCIGAASPEIVRLYNIRSQEMTFPTKYYLISILFFVLGGFVAVILPSTTIWGAFYAGAGLPMIISGAANQSNKPTPTLKMAEQPSNLGVKKYLRSLFS